MCLELFFMIVGFVLIYLGYQWREGFLVFMGVPFSLYMALEAYTEAIIYVYKIGGAIQWLSS